MKNRNTKLKQLKLLYIIIFITTIILVAPTHLFPPPTFMYARFPHYLEMMGTFLGISWPLTFDIYHLVLIILSIIVSFNILGIFFYPKLRLTAQISSFLGLILLTLIFLFFFFVFMRVDANLSLVYSFYALLLLFVDALTFSLFTKK